MAAIMAPPPGNAGGRAARARGRSERCRLHGRVACARMERLANADELLDGPLDEPATLDGNLRDLRRINRWLGGVTLSAAALDALAAHRAELTLLDVGTGGADIPIALARLARTRRR